MVAKQGDNLSTRGPCLALQAHQQIEHLPNVGAAIGVVAGLDERGTTAGPTQLIVDETRTSKDGDEFLVRAMDIANGDKTRRRRLLCNAMDDREQYENGDGKKSHAERHCSVRTAFADGGGMIALPILRSGSCEPFKASVHGAALGLAAVMGIYNAAAWLQRRERHLWVNAVLYGLAIVFEQKHVAHHVQACRDVECRSPATPRVPRAA
jgi:hypothetical protein